MDNMESVSNLPITHSPAAHCQAQFITSDFRFWAVSVSKLLLKLSPKVDLGQIIDIWRD